MPLGPGLSQEHTSRSQPIQAMRHPAPSLLRPTPSNDLWPPTHGSCQNTGSCEPVASSCVCVYPNGLFIYFSHQQNDRHEIRSFTRPCRLTPLWEGGREFCVSGKMLVERFIFLFIRRNCCDRVCKSCPYFDGKPSLRVCLSITLHIYYYYG